jgi:hypothetical protein
VAVRQHQTRQQPASQPTPAPRLTIEDLMPSCRDCGDLADGLDGRCSKCASDREWNARRKLLANY